MLVRARYREKSQVLKRSLNIVDLLWEQDFSSACSPDSDRPDTIVVGVVVGRQRKMSE